MTEKEIESIPEDTNSGPSWGRIVIWGGLFLLLALLAIGLKRTQEGHVQVGQVAPQFTLTTFDGEDYSTIEHAGKVIVVNFWSSWCKPCEQEAADLEAAWRYYQDRGDVIFLGVDYVDTETEARGYLNKFDITYPNGPDKGTKISQAYRISGVPETYIIGKDGILASAQIGPFRSLDQILSVINPLLEQ
ncbi:MAG: TlpA family protein disulfide reductase [Chloroflexi bacterium]|nr:TlpA family protein disulfide reductase [Chloroflexota bacterium]